MADPVWTDQMESYLIKRFNDDATTALIASEVSRQFKIKISRSSVCSKIRRLRKTGAITRPAASPIKRTMSRDESKRLAAERKREYRAKKKGERPTRRAALKSHRYEEIDPPKTIAWDPIEGSLHVSLFALQRGQCAYPLADGTYCGCKTESGSSWCEGHYGRVWRKKTVVGSDKTSWR